MRLPHEQDESSRHDPQRPSRVMRAAHEDLADGRVDTDLRGNASRKAFDDAKNTDSDPEADDPSTQGGR